MNIGTEKSVTLRLNPTNDRVNGILLEMVSDTGERFYVSDINADGIPEQRRSADSLRKEVLYRGDFTPLYEVGMRQWIVTDGSTNEVKFTGTRWELK